MRVAVNLFADGCVNACEQFVLGIMSMFTLVYKVNSVRTARTRSFVRSFCSVFSSQMEQERKSLRRQTNIAWNVVRGQYQRVNYSVESKQKNTIVSVSKCDNNDNSCDFISFHANFKNRNHPTHTHNHINKETNRNILLRKFGTSSIIQMPVVPN